jgi:hypothetical protein
MKRDMDLVRALLLKLEESVLTPLLNSGSIKN